MLCNAEMDVLSGAMPLYIFILSLAIHLPLFNALKQNSVRAFGILLMMHLYLNLKYPTHVKKLRLQIQNQ